MTILFLGVTALLILLLLNACPVGFAMLIAGSIGILLAVGDGVAISVLRLTPHEHVASYTLSTLPMFVLMAELLTAARFTRDLFNASYKWMGHIKGGLAYASIAGGAMLSAVSGSSSASAGTLAGAAYPEMKRYGYDDSFSTATVAVSGTLAIIIPPSIALVVYGIITESSVGALFLAGVIPGLITAIGYFIAIKITLSRNPDFAPTAPSRFPASERLSSLRTTWPVIVLMLFLLIAIYTGIATVTEIGAISALLALLLAAGLGRLTLKSAANAFMSAARNSIMILTIIFGASVFGAFATLTGVPQTLVQAVNESGFGSCAVVLLILAIFLALGFFLDQMAALLLVLPIAYPVLHALGVNEIWFGILVVKTVEIGLLTPPMGLNCFIVSSVTRVPVQQVFRGIWWFVLLDLAVIAILLLVPDLVLFLPRLAGVGGL